MKIELHPEEQRTEFLQKILLDFLAVNAQEENLIWDYARHFYLAQWYRDIIYQRRRIKEGEKGFASKKPKSRLKQRSGKIWLCCQWLSILKGLFFYNNYSRI